MKPLLRVVLILNALVFLAFGLLFVLTPWAGLYEALQLTPIHVEPAFVGVLFGIALIGLAWLAFHAAIDGALTARAARVSGHVQWLSGVVIFVWPVAINTLSVERFGQMLAAVVGGVLVVLGLGSVRLSSAVRRRERAARAGAASAEQAEKRAAQKRDEARSTPDVIVAPDTAIRPSARAPGAPGVTSVDSTARPLDASAPIAPVTRGMDGGAVDPITGATLDPVTGRKLDPVTGREIDPVTGARIEPVISGEIDPVTGRRVGPANGAPR